jgi:hypothetical protein
VSLSLSISNWGFGLLHLQLDAPESLLNMKITTNHCGALLLAVGAQLVKAIELDVNSLGLLYI